MTGQEFIMPKTSRNSPFSRNSLEVETLIANLDGNELKMNVSKRARQKGFKAFTAPYFD